MISQDEAVRLVRNTSKYAHAVMVSAVMEGLASRLGENKQEWRLVGLLHDLDYDEVKGDMSKHGVVAAERLKGKLPEHCIYAIKAHDHRTGFKPKSRLDNALVATDSLTTVIARNGKTAEGFNIEGLREELQIVSANEPWLRNNVMECEKIGLNLDEFLQLCLDSMTKYDTEQRESRSNLT